MALALGVWSGSRKRFEIFYVLLWYGGPFNRTPQIDFLGVGGGALEADVGLWFFAASAVLLGIAWVGRKIRREG